jgi:biotin carboxyl carrier protein
MRYTLFQSTEENTYRVKAQESGLLTVLNERDEQITNVDIRAIQDGFLHLIIAGKSYDVPCSIEGHLVKVSVRGENYAFEVYDDRALRIRNLEGTDQVRVVPDIRAPMAGRIIEVKVSADTLVAEGDPLVIIEAMKMENLIRAPHGGQVEQLNVKSGHAVEAGTHLLTVRPIEEDNVNV